MNINWNDLEKSICDFYLYLKLDISSKEIDYLKNAFLFTENLWEKQLSKINEINYIMISEAPLFGNEKKYFYNPKSKPTSFFWFNDIKAFDIVFSKEDYNNKKFLLDKLNEKGFLILDIFPFALNKKYTQIDFRSIKSKDYQRLYKKVIHNYLIKKLNLIKIKSSCNVKTFYRYKRLKKKLGLEFEEQLIKLKLIQKDDKLKVINKNMSIDKEKLRKLVSN